MTRAPAMAVLYVVVFINLVGFGVVVPLLPFFAQTLDASPWQVTLVFAAYSFGQFLGEPWWGRLSDRIGRKPVLLITTASNIVGYIALAFAPDIWTAIAVRLVTGFGAGSMSTVQGYVADITPPQQRAGRMGLIGSAFGLGFIVGPGIGGLLSPLGYTVPLFAAAGLCAVAALGVLLVLRESRVPAAPGMPRQRFLAGLKAAQANPVVSRILVINFVYMAGFAGMEATFALFTEERFDWTARDVGLCFMAIGVVIAFNQALVSGRLARRFGEAKVLTCGMAVFAASLLLHTINTVSWAVAPISAIGAFGMSLAMPNIASLISRSVPPERQGAMLGLNMATGAGARVAGPAMAGVIFQAFGPNAPFQVGAVLTALAAVMAVNAGIAFKRAQTLAP